MIRFALDAATDETAAELLNGASDPPAVSQMVLPVFGSRRSSVSPGKPRATIRLVPTTTGDDRPRPPSDFCQAIWPLARCSAYSLPSSALTKIRPSRTAGVPWMPSPAANCHSSRPVEAPRPYTFPSIAATTVMPSATIGLATSWAPCGAVHDHG